MAGGGAERQLTYLCAELIRQRCEVHVALVHDGPNMPRLVGTGAAVTRLACRNNHDPALLYQIARLVGRAQPDVVHTWLRQMDVLGGMVALALGKPLIVSERGSGSAYPRHWKHLLRIGVGRRASVVVANSQAGADHWLRLGAKPGRVVIARNAIPFDEIDRCPPDPSVLSAGSNAESIVFAGRLVPQKNLPVMLEALRLVLDQRSGATAYLFGVGPLQDTLVAFRDRHRLGDRMRICGYHDPIWGVLKAATLFVSVSRFEGMPNVVLECAAVGCPMVLSDITEHREIFDDDSALFVPFDDPARAAEGILRVLTDRAGALGRAANARGRIESWSTGAMASRHVEIYRSVAGSAPALG